MNLYDFDEAVAAEGYPVLCGLDEAGRGPLAGRVYAAACVLPSDFRLDGLNDSKKLTPKVRDSLYEVIIAEAVDFAVAFADEKEIDRINILAASMLAMRRAAAQLSAVNPDLYLVDGNRHPGITAAPCRTIVKGDGKSACIAAASILAKVSRDRYMDQMSALYPQYGFEQHKGYPTELHYARLAEYGPCEIHRVTFLKNMAEKHSAPSRGAQGEQTAADYLAGVGYAVLTRNARTKSGELDIIAAEGDELVFVEVKQRAQNSIDRPAAFVNASKQRKLRAAALEWLAEKNDPRPFRFDVVEVWGEQVNLIKNAF